MGDKMYKKYLAGSLLAAALPAHADYVTVISFGTPERLSRPLIGIDMPWP